MTENDQVKMLRTSLNVIIKTLLVAGRSGLPAEGKIPFNPLYFNILRMVGAAGAIRPSNVADDLSVPRTTVSTAFKALSKIKLIETIPDPTDKRAINVMLSHNGEEVLAAIIRQDIRNADAMLSLLDENEREKFVKLTHKISSGLSELKQHF